MNQYIVDEHITYTREISKVYCNRCNQEIHYCSVCNFKFGYYHIPGLPYSVNEEMIECKDEKHLCIRCLEKRALAKLENEKK